MNGGACTDLVAGFVTGLGASRAAWADLTWLPLLAPLAAAHLGLVVRRRGSSSWERAARPLALSWTLFVWGALALYLSLATVVGIDATLLAWVEGTTLGSLAYTLALLVVMLLLVPRLLLACLDTVPPSAGLRRLAEEPRFAGASFRLLEWRTADELSNAMVLAMPLGPRPVLFTDGFLGRLSLPEFEAVLAHELGHVRRRHVSTMAAWVLGGALTFDLVAEALLPLELLDGPWGIAIALGFLITLALAIGWLSRRLELEADLCALEVTGDWRPLARVLRGFGSRRRRRATWRHFAPRERVLFLRAAARDPGVARRLTAPLRALRAGGLVLATLALALLVARGVAGLDGERVWLDLRQGDLAAAWAAYVELEPEQRELVHAAGLDQGYFEHLLELGAELQTEAPLTTRTVGRAALDAGLGASDPVLVHHLDLALFLDAEPALWDLRDVLVDRAKGRPTELPSDLPEPWGRLVRD